MKDVKKTKQQLIDELNKVRSKIIELEVINGKLEQEVSRLRVKNKNYELMIDSQNELLIKIDTNGNLLFVSKAYCSMFRKTAEELLGTSFISLIYEDDRESTLWKLKSVYTAPYYCYVEQRALTKRGCKWFGWAYNAVLDNSGTVSAIVGVGRDITKRKQTEETLRNKLRFERTIKKISSRFVGVDNIDKAINLSLADLGDLSGASRVYLFLFSAGNTLMSNTHEWCAQGVSPQIQSLQDLPCTMFPWWMDKLQKGEHIYIPDVSAMPEEAKAEKETLESQGIKSLLVLPVYKTSELVGFIGFDEVNRSVDWKEDEFTLLGVASEIIGNALERQAMEKLLRQSEQQYRTIFENTGTATVIIEENAIISLANAEFEILSGFSRSEIEGKKSFEEFFVDDELEKVKKYHYMRRIDPSSVPQNYETRLVNRQGEVKHAIVTVAILPGTKRSVASFLNITDRKHAEQELQYLSFHDSLTGLYNRTFFEQEMKRLEKIENNSVGLIMCDVDGLKLVNDTLGHHSGDILLQTVANLLKSCLCPKDVIARIGGDEFAILLPGSNKSSVKRAYSRIMDAIEKYNRSKPKLYLNLSIGYAIRKDNTKTMVELFKEADDNMYREKLHHVHSNRSTLIQTLMRALEARDFITEGHAERLQGIVSILAEAIGYSDRIADLRLFARFHDIGKVGIPDSILFKAGSLTPEEFNVMQRHCEMGYRIAKSSIDLMPIADWILMHHEWWDGNGYPLGLKGEEIPLECRILAIADAYDAMTSNRPYQKAMSHENALRELEKCAGTQFDPGLVREFIKLADKLEGS